MKTPQKSSSSEKNHADQSQHIGENGIETHAPQSKSYIQRALQIGSPDDPLEKEADQMADQVVQKQHLAAPSQHQRSQDEIRRKKQEGLSATNTPQSEPKDFSTQLKQSVGKGKRMDTQTQSEMEAVFGANFSQVNIHTDSQSARLSRQIQAKAFTHGNDIFFNQNTYQPHSHSGKHLLAHELTHVIQQSGSGSPNLIQRQEAANTSEVEMVSRYVTIPRGVHSAQEFFLYAEVKLFGKVVHKTWTPKSEETRNILNNLSAHVGHKISFTFARWELDQFRENPRDTAKDRSEYRGLRGTKKDEVNAEIDRRFYEDAKLEEGTKIDRRDKGRVAVWNSFRDEVMADRRKIRELPEGIKNFLFDEEARNELSPKDYETVLRLAEKLNGLSAAELKEYKSRVTSETTDWAVFEGSIDLFLKERMDRRVNQVEKDEIETKLADLGDLYDRYRSYVSMLKNNANLSAMGASNPGALGVSMGSQPTLNKMREELTADLVKAGFPGGISDFEAYIKRYEQVFFRETVALSKVLLDQYEHLLLEAQEKYKDPAVVQGIHQAVQASGAKADFEEANQIREDHAQTVVMSLDEMQDQAYWVGKRNEALGKGIAKVRSAVPQDEHIQKSNFPHEQLALATSEADAQSILSSYIFSHITDVQETRLNIYTRPEMVYGLTDLLEASIKAQHIQKGSMFDKIVRNHISDKNWEEAIPKIMLGVIAFAVGLLTFGGGFLAGAAAAASFGLSAYQAYEEFREYEIKQAAVGAELLSDDPSLGWVILAVVGAALDLAAVASTLKAVKPAVQALETTGDVAKFDEALGLLVEQGKIEQRIAQRIVTASHARDAANDAAKGFFKALSGKVYSFPGPFADPEVYVHLVKFARSKLDEGVSEFLVFLDKLKLARAEAKLGEMTSEELLAAKEAWRQASSLREVLGDGGKVLGRYVEGDFLEVVSKSSNLHGGNVIKLNPNKTTTITGALGDVDTVARRGMSGDTVIGITKMGENQGGINLLRSPKWKEIQAKHIALKSRNETAYWRTVSDEFWETVNKPWLDDAISRGDNIRLVSDPNLEKNMFVMDRRGRSFILDENGEKIPSIFSREIDHLKANGYTIRPDGTAVKP